MSSSCYVWNSIRHRDSLQGNGWYKSWCHGLWLCYIAIYHRDTDLRHDGTHYNRNKVLRHGSARLVYHRYRVNVDIYPALPVKDVSIRTYSG
jgi:hypothetical protein